MSQGSNDPEINEILNKKFKKLNEDAKIHEESKDLICSSCGTTQASENDLVMLHDRTEHKTCAKCMLAFAHAFVNQPNFILQISTNGKFFEIQQVDPVTGTKSERKIIPTKKSPIAAIQGTVTFYKVVPKNKPTGKITVKRKGENERTIGK